MYRITYNYDIKNKKTGNEIVLGKRGRFKNTACYSGLYSEIRKLSGKDYNFEITLFFNKETVNDGGRYNEDYLNIILRAIEQFKFNIEILEKNENKAVLKIISDNQHEIKFITSLLRLAHEGDYMKYLKDNYYDAIKILKLENEDIDEFAILRSIGQHANWLNGHSPFQSSGYVIKSDKLLKIFKDNQYKNCSTNILVTGGIGDLNKNENFIKANKKKALNGEPRFMRIIKNYLIIKENE